MPSSELIPLFRLLNATAEQFFSGLPATPNQSASDKARISSR